MSNIIGELSTYQLYFYEVDDIKGFLKKEFPEFVNLKKIYVVIKEIENDAETNKNISVLYGISLLVIVNGRILMRDEIKDIKEDDDIICLIDSDWEYIND